MVSNYLLYLTEVADQAKSGMLVLVVLVRYAFVLAVFRSASNTVITNTKHGISS